MTFNANGWTSIESCRRKRGYSSEGEAVRAARSYYLKRKQTTKPYRCNQCVLWHLAGAPVPDFTRPGAPPFPKRSKKKAASNG